MNLGISTSFWCFSCSYAQFSWQLRVTHRMLWTLESLYLSSFKKFPSTPFTRWNAKFRLFQQFSCWMRTTYLVTTPPIAKPAMLTDVLRGSFWHRFAMAEMRIAQFALKNRTRMLIVTQNLCYCVINVRRLLHTKLQWNRQCKGRMIHANCITAKHGAPALERGFIVAS